MAAELENAQGAQLEKAAQGAADKAKLEKAASEIDFKDPSLTLSYGSKPMDAIAKFSDSILSRVKVRDSGEIGGELLMLLGKVRGVNVGAIAEKPSGLASIPIIGKLFDRTQAVMSKFSTVSEEIGKIKEKLEDSQLSLLKDVEVLEQLYAKNGEFYQDLTAYIEAGRAELERARAEDLKALEEKAKNTGDSFDAQAVRDFAETLNRFERRLHDLALSRTIAIQTAPQIRLIQNNDRVLAEKIQTSILTTIPVWKNQLVLALSLKGQQAAAQLQKDVADTTDALLRKNAQMLHDSTVETARESERALVDVETLREVQGKLISSIEETLAIAAEGHEKRVKAEAEIAAMESDLKSRLTDLASRSREQAISQAEGKDSAK
ncbi:MAG: toxic anion resistance protein [Aeromonadales bacterium]|nr:toxic anion resistance protein [Aeromonadales bacterium]MDY2890878.1 toxic anion resistance protein [Succinivibrio sp.]